MRASQVVLVVKNSPANAGDLGNSGSIPESGMSPGGGHSNPVQYSCLKNSMDRGTWWAAVHRVSQSRKWLKLLLFSSVQSLSRIQLCNPMVCSTPKFPVHHQLPGLTLIHVHRVGDVIQPSHLLSSPSPPTSTLSQHQGIFQQVSLYQVAKVLAFQL